jgi:hypothetical protein
MPEKTRAFLASAEVMTLKNKLEIGQNLVLGQFGPPWLLARAPVRSFKRRPHLIVNLTTCPRVAGFRRARITSHGDGRNKTGPEKKREAGLRISNRSLQTEPNPERRSQYLQRNFEPHARKFAKS